MLAAPLFGVLNEHSGSELVTRLADSFAGVGWTSSWESFLLLACMDVSNHAIVSVAKRLQV